MMETAEISAIEGLTDNSVLSRVTAQYRSPIVRAYIHGRFRIIHLPMIRVLDGLLPREGRILDVGCGFGLFSLCFALSAPARRIYGFDLNPRRIAAAIRAREGLGLTNVEFAAADATRQRIGEVSGGTSSSAGSGAGYDGIITLDLLHHVSPWAKYRLLQSFHRNLTPDGVLVIKDVTTYPLHRIWFTWIMDKIVSPKSPTYYQSHKDFVRMLERIGFTVTVRILKDPLPYPHVILLCRKRLDSINA